MNRIATRVVESTRENFGGWFRSVALAYLGFAAAVVALVGVARLGTEIGVWVLGLALTLATLKLDDAMRAERRKKGSDARIARVVVALGQLLFAVVLLVVRSLVVHNDALAFLALVTVVLSLGALVAEWRFSILWMHRRGPVLLGIALLFAAVGLFVVPASTAWLALLFVGVALPIGYLGTELYTEDWLRRPARPTWKSLVYSGTLLLVAGGAAMLRGGYLPYVLLVLIVVFLAVAATASDSNSAAVVLVIAVALVWSTAPRPAAEPDIVPVDGRPAFVALGDSFMSGEGARRFLEGTNTKGVNQCRRAPSAYAERLALSPPAGVPDRVLFLACSGAKALDIYQRSQEQSPNQLARYAAFKAAHPNVAIKFVLVSVSGNDAGFGDVGKTCVGPGDCSEIGQRWLTDLGAVEVRISEAYARIKAAFPGVPVIAVPYPVPIAPDKCAWSTLTADEHRFLYGFTNELNQVVASAASRTGAYYLAEMEDALVPGKLRICDGSPGKIGVNYLAANPVTGRLSDALNPQNWIHNSFHPNGVGHGAMLDAVTRFLRAYPDLMPPAPSGEAPHVVPSLDAVMGKPAVERCGRGSVAYCSLGSGPWALTQVVVLLRTVLAPLLLALLGAWLLVIPMIRWATEHEVTTFKLLARLWGRVRRP